MSQRESIARVLAHVDSLTDTMLAEAARVVRLPSVSGTDGENEGQAHMAALFDRGGLEVDHWSIDLDAIRAHGDFPGMEVERTEAWGLVGRLPGSGDGATLMLNGHIDVVPTGDPDAWVDDPFSGAFRGDRLLGRGSCDMKAGLIAAHWAAQAIRTSGVRLRGDLLVASVQGEEDGGLGTFATLQRGWTADACVIPEPTELDIIPANSGALTFRLRVRGQATHAARRTDGVSSIDKFWPVWRAIQELEQRRHEHVDPLTARWALAHPISIGTVHGGDWASSVPDLLVAEGRLGVAIGEPVDHARAEFEAAVARRVRRRSLAARHIRSRSSGGAVSSRRDGSRATAISSSVSKRRTARSPEAGGPTSTAHRTAATFVSSPASAASRPCSTGPATRCSPTGRWSRSPSRRSSPPRAPSP